MVVKVSTGQKSFRAMEGLGVLKSLNSVVKKRGTRDGELCFCSPLCCISLHIPAVSSLWKEFNSYCSLYVFHTG